MVNGNKDTWKIYILTLIAFVVGTAQFSIAGMLDQVATSLDISIASAGQLITAYALGNAVGTPVFMILTPKMKQKNQLIIALIVFALGVVSIMVFSNYYILVLSRAVTGLGSGIFSVTAYGMAVKLAPEGKQGSAMSNVAMGVSSSLVFGVPLGRIISSIYGWRAIFGMIIVITVISLILVMSIIPDFKVEETTGNNQESKLKTLKNPLILAALSMTFCVFIGFSIVDSYITPFLLGTMPQMESSISLILMALGVGSLIGSRLGGYLADRIGVTKTVTIALIAQIVFLVLTTLLVDLGLPGIVAIMMWEISCWTFGPIQNLNLVSLAPKVSTIVLSLNSTFVQIGIAIGSAVGGVLISEWGVRAIPWFSAAAAIVAYMFLNINRYHVKQRLKIKEVGEQ